MKNVLLALVGMNPAVLTETVWALVTEKKIIPDEVVVLTTTEGRAKIKKELVDSGVWENMKTALAAKRIDIEGKLLFGDSNDAIRIFSSKDKKSNLNDIATSEDNDAAADFIMRNIREFSEDPETTIWASLAGGRKTMSALMMACMNLLGREQDHVLHVLVNPPYDGCLKPLFFFPEKNKKHATLEGKTIKSTDAKITLIDVPFVKMRSWYEGKFKKNPPSYRELVSDVQGSAYQCVTINYNDATLTIDGKETLKLAATEFAVLALKVHNKINKLQEIQERLKEFKIPESLKNPPQWLYKLVDTEHFDYGKSEGASRSMSSARKKLEEYLPSHLSKILLPLRDDPVTYPINKIKFIGKNPFTDIRR